MSCLPGVNHSQAGNWIDMRAKQYLPVNLATVFHRNARPRRASSVLEMM